MIKELLAPAGDIEAGYAALYYGADAVYLGLQKFSARATATNFDEPHLNEFVAFAHSLTPRRRVYAAINTVVQESEFDDLISVLEICKRCQVDGVIVHDFFDSIFITALKQRHFINIVIHCRRLYRFNIPSFFSLRNICYRLWSCNPILLHRSKGFGQFVAIGNIIHTYQQSKLSILFCLISFFPTKIQLYTNPV